MYRLGEPVVTKRRRRRWPWVLIILLILVGLALAIFISHLKPDTKVSSPTSHTTQITYSRWRHYKETDFNIDIPIDWRLVAKPIIGDANNQSYAWQSADIANKGQTIEVYEDSLPQDFPINRVLAVRGQGDRLALKGQISPDCKTFVTSNTPAPNQPGVEASWQDVNFLCDKRQQPRVVTGTVAPDGINSVNLKSPTTGTVHKFFITYIDYVNQPDYQTFYDVLKSLRLQ